MISQEKNEDDLLRHYMNSDHSENAPEGFTSNVMTRIRLEKIPSKSRARWWKRNCVLLISSSVVIILAGIALLWPVSKTDPLTLQLTGILKSLISSVPKPDFSHFTNFTIPPVMLYTIAGIAFLTLFDRILYRVFHRE